MDVPALHGNWIDLVILAFIVFYLWDGWGKGFLALIFELIAFVGSFVFSLKLYSFVAQLLVSNFSFPQGLANAAGFFLVGILVEQLLSHLSDFLYHRIPEKWHRNKLNQISSVIPLSANAFVIVAFILTLTLSLPIKGSIKASVADSKIGGAIVGRTQVIERRLAHIFSEAVSDTINFITIAPRSDEQVQLNFTQPNSTIDETAETQMFELVNNERLKRGLPGLQFDARLRDLARVYARDMFTRGYFSHYNPEGLSPFQRMQEAHITYEVAGENLALAPSVTIAHQGLMESQGHRENILHVDFGRVGIGVMDGGIYGKMFVQEFTN